MKRRVYIGAFLFSLAVSAFAQVRIVMPEIDTLITQDGTGLYQQVLARAAAQAGLKYRSQVFPKLRALYEFQENQDWDGIFTFTATVRASFPGETILASYPFGAYKGYIFTPKGTPALTGPAELRGLKVGGLRGFEGTWTQLTDSGIRIEVVESDQQNLGMLKAGRIQAMLGFLPDLYIYLPELSYDPAKPFFQSYDRLTGRNTPEMRSFLERLNVELIKMHRDGTIKAMLGDSYMPISGEFSLED